MKTLLSKFLLLLVLFNKVYGDICDRSCECIPKEDPMEVSCINASIHIIPQDLPPYIDIFKTGHSESTGLEQKNQLSRLNALDFEGLAGLKTLISLLEHLDLSNNQIYTFSHNVFHGLKKLKSLDLSHNRLTSMSFLRDLNLPILQNLMLDGNNFGQIRENSPFQRFQSLEFLSLVGCRLSKQSSDFFTGLSGLKELDLTDNLIETLPSKSLDNNDLNGLSILRVGSIIFRELNSGIGRLKGLTELSISGCINSLPFHFEKNSLQNNTKLKGVNITSCPGLYHLPDGAFLDLPHLEYLHLRSNTLQSISPRIADWNSLNSVDLKLNPFKCDCSMSWIFELPGYDHFRSFIQTASCEDGDSLSHSKFLHCEKNIYSSHFWTIILGSVTGGLSLIALIILGFWIFHRKKKKGSVSRFRRRKFGKINKHEISVIPERVSNPAGYKDVLTEESLPLGRNLSNFPDVKTSVL
ncbi:unnamed protein product [Lepeophtheirus salmonis]|uniref:(salmon louse) hypothetical protein n=1 Tax=Lepeophtheirus salmonis TaxID=72036 RepID=A0A7R8H2K5_LEPSM|nr:unnamed protein product [Lepeophtheirus salmonis]CAF2825779.1 unnamed protein product [Lepeophtheirus salmonis]